MFILESLYLKLKLTCYKLVGSMLKRPSAVCYDPRVGSQDCKPRILLLCWMYCTKKLAIFLSLQILVVKETASQSFYEVLFFPPVTEGKFLVHGTTEDALAPERRGQADMTSAPHLAINDHTSSSGSG